MFLNFGIPVGCWEDAIIHPRLISKRAVPSTFQENFSFRIHGDRIALNIMVKQDVDEMSSMLPNARATAFRTPPITIQRSPTYIYHYLNLD